MVWLLPPYAGWFCFVWLLRPMRNGFVLFVVILSSLFSCFRLMRDGLVFWGATSLSGDIAWKDKPTPSAAINFRHSLKISVSRGSLLPSSGHALHPRGLCFHDVARTASQGATSLSGDVA